MTNATDCSVLLHKALNQVAALEAALRAEDWSEAAYWDWCLRGTLEVARERPLDPAVAPLAEQVLARHRAAVDRALAARERLLQDAASLAVGWRGARQYLKVAGDGG